jgi:fumarate reductase subunit C
VVHAKSWFEIIPKTMPKLFVGGRRLSAAAITRTGWALACLATLVLLALAWGWQR